LRLERFDAIVIAFGAKDATRLAQLGRWTRRMEALLRFLYDHPLVSAMSSFWVSSRCGRLGCSIQCWERWPTVTPTL
jgi:hypothetical protein